ncbi:hypothetical protein [Cohnella sp.]|uniref:hypothetical protein n=1 Tax=Cohnella sp. TaxID=1883426 RepID=UPI00356755F7
MNYIRIVPQGEKFAVELEHSGSTQEMDVRNAYADAEDYAFYLAQRMKVDVYYRGQKIDPRTRS